MGVISSHIVNLSCLLSPRLVGLMSCWGEAVLIEEQHVFSLRMVKCLPLHSIFTVLESCRHQDAAEDCPQQTSQQP